MSYNDLSHVLYLSTERKKEDIEGFEPDFSPDFKTDYGFDLANKADIFTFIPKEKPKGPVDPNPPPKPDPEPVIISYNPIDHKLEVKYIEGPMVVTKKEGFGNVNLIYNNFLHIVVLIIILYLLL